MRRSDIIAFLQILYLVVYCYYNKSLDLFECFHPYSYNNFVHLL
nr:MAG TPA: hypothetical protein [Caudoviricetes sp.]